MVKGTAYLDLNHSVFSVIQQLDFPDFHSSEEGGVGQGGCVFYMKNLIIFGILTVFSPPKPESDNLGDTSGSPHFGSMLSETSWSLVGRKSNSSLFAEWISCVVSQWSRNSLSSVFDCNVAMKWTGSWLNLNRYGGVIIDHVYGSLAIPITQYYEPKMDRAVNKSVGMQRGVGRFRGVAGKSVK